MSYVYPNCVCVVAHEGGRVRLNPDQKWPTDDPFVKARPELFSGTPRQVAHSDGYEPVERATRAPGERRAVKRAPKAAESQADD